MLLTNVFIDLNWFLRWAMWPMRLLFDLKNHSDVCYSTGIINIIQMTEKCPVFCCKAQGPQHSVVGSKVMACHTEHYPSTHYNQSLWKVRKTSKMLFNFVQRGQIIQCCTKWRDIHKVLLKISKTYFDFHAMFLYSEECHHPQHHHQMEEEMRQHYPHHWENQFPHHIHIHIYIYKSTQLSF